jgi:O-antigen ligase
MAAVSTPLREPGSGLGAFAGLAGLALLGAALGVSLVFGELDAFWIALSAIACVGVLYDFRAGAVLLILMLPIAESNIFPRAIGGITGMNPLNLIVAATLVSFALHGRARKVGAPFLPKPLFWLYLVPLLVGGLLGARHAGEIAPILYDSEAIHFLDAAGYLRDIVAKPMVMVIAALLIGAAAARSKKPERFLLPMGISMWVICGLSVLFVARTSLSLAVLADPGERAFLSGTGLHANDLGRLYAVAYALLLFVWAESKSRPFRLLCLATMGVVTLALVFTFSRGAFLGFLIVNGLFLLWRMNAKTVAIVLLAGIALLLVLPHEVFMRASMGFGEDANAVSAGRIDGIWLPVLPEIWKSPLWGQGLGSVMWSDAMRSGLMFEVTHPHSAYLEALLDVGAIGLALLVGYFVHVWRNFRALGSNPFLSPEMRGFYQGAAAALISFFVTGFAGSSFAPRPEYAFLWIAIGMMYGQLARRPAA